jgi:hypothetical protein
MFFRTASFLILLLTVVLLVQAKTRAVPARSFPHNALEVLNFTFLAEL